MEVDGISSTAAVDQAQLELEMSQRAYELQQNSDASTEAIQQQQAMEASLREGGLAALGIGTIINTTV